MEQAEARPAKGVKRQRESSREGESHRGAGSQPVLHPASAAQHSTCTCTAEGACPSAQLSAPLVSLPRTRSGYIKPIYIVCEFITKMARVPLTWQLQYQRVVCVLACARLHSSQHWPGLPGVCAGRGCKLVVNRVYSFFFALSWCFVCV